MSRTVALVVVLAALAGAGATFALTGLNQSEPGAPPPTILTRENASGATTTVTRTTTTTTAGVSAGSGYLLARVRRGARVAVRAEPGGRVRGQLGARSEFGSPRVLWVDQRRGPWLGVVAPEIGNNRLGWIRRDRRALSFHTTRYSLRVNLTRKLVQLRLGDRVVRNVVVSVGRFGSETPPGRFAVTDRIVRGLSPTYGCCAIALSARQPNPPAGWIGGDRIAIHGWKGPVGAAASAGCLRASNADMLALIKRVPLGAPVLISS